MREWFCQHFQLPLAINSTHRAAPAFIKRTGNTSWLGLMIPKCGTTTLERFALEHNLTTWMSPHVLDACKSMSYATIVTQASAIAVGDTMSFPHPATLPSTSCGHAATFDLSPREPTFAVAFVRDPVERFISALNPHHPGEIQPQYIPRDIRIETFDTIGANVSVLELLAQRAQRMRSRLNHVDDAHVRTQSYYLAATNREGGPIRWDAIFRLEESHRFSATLAAALLEDLGWNISARQTLRHAAHTLFAIALNTKDAREALHHRSSGHSSRGLRDAVVNHPSLACDLCAIYGQDFACLGYPWPPKCAEPECLRTLSHPLRAAIVRDTSLNLTA